MGGKTLTRADLAEAVYRKVGLSRTESAELVEAVLDEICEAIVRGETVKLGDLRADLAGMANVIHGELRDEGDGPVALQGNLLVAPIGWRLALLHPERITAIVSQNGNAYEEGLPADHWAAMRAYWALLRGQASSQFSYRASFAVDLVANVWSTALDVFTILVLFTAWSGSGEATRRGRRPAGVRRTGRPGSARRCCRRRCCCRAPGS